MSSSRGVHHGSGRDGRTRSQNTRSNLPDTRSNLPSRSRGRTVGGRGRSAERGGTAGRPRVQRSGGPPPLAFDPKRVFAEVARQMAADQAKAAQAVTASPEMMFGAFNEFVPPDIQSGGGPILTAMPDRGSYMAPYDTAETSVRKYNEQVRPRIDSGYENLKAQVAALGVKSDASGAAWAASTAGAQQEALAAIQASAAGAAGSMEAQGFGPSAGAATELAAAEAGVKRQFAAQQTLAANRNQATVESTAARHAGAESGKVNALLNADANMQIALSEIGLGRAGAERAFNEKSASVSRDNQKAQQDFVLMQGDINQQNLDNRVKSAETRRKLYQDALRSPKSIFEANAVKYSKEAPDTWSLFQEVVGEASGKGQMGLTDALSILALPEVGATDEERNTLEKWLADYYDETPRILDREAARASGLFEGGW